jgi:hypothetical protein
MSSIIVGCIPQDLRTLLTQFTVTLLTAMATAISICIISSLREIAVITLPVLQHNEQEVYRSVSALDRKRMLTHQLDRFHASC